MISCSRSVVLLLDDGEPVFLLDRDGEAAGTFSRHSPERGDRERVLRVTENKQRVNYLLFILAFQTISIYKFIFLIELFGVVLDTWMIIFSY